MALEWWHWTVLGLVLVMSELVLTSFVLIWFGLGAVLVGLALLMLPALSLTTQLACWLAASLLMVWLWFKVFKPHQHKTRVGMADSMIGEIGLLTRDCEPFQQGEVRFQRPVLGAEVWPCLSDEPLQAGMRVKLKAVEGVLLRVGRT